MRVEQVAEELGVRYVLEGSMQRSGDRVRVNAQLIDALSGRHVWAERYDRETGDLFALQDDIIGNVITEIEVTLTEGEQARLYRRSTDDLDAYLHLMRGMGHFRKFRRNENTRARLEFEKALALDPDYGFALQQLGYSHWADARYRWSDSRAESLAQAEALAARAIEADYPARSLLSSIHFLKGDFERALAERRRNIELGSNSADGQALMAWTLTLVGRPAEAIVYAKTAMRLSPFYPNWYLGVLGDAYRLLGRFDEAVDAFETVVERDPKDVWRGRVRLAASLTQAGRIDEAKRVVDDPGRPRRRVGASMGPRHTTHSPQVPVAAPAHPPLAVILEPPGSGMSPRACVNWTHGSLIGPPAGAP